MFESKLPFSINTCNITSSPEKFVCINMQCSDNQDQAFGCYECLIKKHKQIDQLHFEKIIEITAFLSQIKQKQQKKINILNKLIQDCDSKKNLVQQQILEDENIVNNDLLQQRIEQLFHTYLTKLQNEKDSISLAPTYSHLQHLKLLKFYHEDIEQYQKAIAEKGIKLQGDVNEILEKCQLVTILQFNKLKNELETLSKKLEQQYQKIVQLETEKAKEKRNPFIQTLIWLQLPLFYLVLILLIYQECNTFYYTNFQDLDSGLVLNSTYQKSYLDQNQTYQQYQINQTNYTNQTNQTKQDKQEKQSKSQNKNNQQWLISEILENRSVDEFQNFMILYDQSFNQSFTQDTYERIQKRVFWDKKDKIVCIGARENKNLRLIGCDLASEVFSVTQDAYSARKSMGGQIYWYWVQSKSFGFSPNKKIALSNIDNEDPSSELRFSFGTAKNVEERRVGSRQGYQNTKQYNLIIYALKYNN